MPDLVWKWAQSRHAYDAKNRAAGLKASKIEDVAPAKTKNDLESVCNSGTTCCVVLTFL